MATKPLPMFLTDENGRPAKKDDKSPDAKKLIESQTNQMAVFDVMATLLTNINQNLSLIALNMLPETLRTLMDQSEMLEESQARKNELKQKESEREAGLGKDEKEMSPLGKLFQEYFGGLKRVVTIITAVLIPFLLGFLLSFVDLTKPLDLLKAALTGLAVYIGGKFLVLLAKNWLKGLFMGPKVINAPGSVINAGGIPGTPAGKSGKGGSPMPIPIPPVPLPEGAAAGGMLTKLIGAFKGILRVVGRLFIPLTIIMGVVDGILGAIEGFKEGGILGGIKGALVGIINGLVGWLVGIGQFIVSGLLDLFGFEDVAKIVEEFNFKEFLKKYISFLSPIGLLIGLFDESSPIRKQFSAALDKLSNIGNFVSNIWEDITKAIREVLIKLADAVPFGSRLLSWLGIKKPDEEKIAAGGGGTAEDEKAISSAQERLRKEGEPEAAEALQEADDIDEAKRMLKKYGFDDKRASELLGVPQASAAPKAVPAPPANTAEELNRKTEESRAKPPETPAPTVNNITSVNAPNNIRSTTNMNQAPHAERAGLGSRGNAGFSGFSKAYT
jgi:hypothetical protein